ncbi:MAG: hypothetical protein HYW24_02265 [Candidatus Aenigmarchaeota archaeon]|nr:hypothetical protein [Candidatus Aenigmarchaeota archaeon]
METNTQTDYFYDILQSLALIHSELVAIREMMEKNKDVQNPQSVQTTLKRE